MQKKAYKKPLTISVISLQETSSCNQGTCNGR